jgi:hypothetical protein
VTRDGCGARRNEEYRLCACGQAAVVGTGNSSAFDLNEQQAVSSRRRAQGLYCSLFFTSNIPHNIKKFGLTPVRNQVYCTLFRPIFPEPKAPKKGLFLPLLKVYTGSFVNAVKGFPPGTKTPMLTSIKSEAPNNK